jgi:putative hydrolase of the HAD superfamily
VAADYIPKPEQHAFDQFMQKTNIDPTGAVMIEDMARNLQPAAALGMRTVWLDSDIEWATQGADSDYVHYRADDLKGFLAAVAA